MPILLYRIDDRLIHGQVVVGWGAHLDLDYVIVVDDQLAESGWEQDLYRVGLSDSVEGHFLTVAEAAKEIPRWRQVEQQGIVLTRDIATMRRLAERGVLDGEMINLGGIHDAPGRRRVLPYVFLDNRDREELLLLSRAGVQVSARDVPSARSVELDEILGRRSG